MKHALYKVIITLGVALCLASPVLAHGVIVRAEPPLGSALEVPPTQVRLWFSEPVDPSFSTIEVYSAGSQERVDLGGLRLAEDGSLVVTLQPNLPQGAYTVVWRAFTPGDGHQTSGSYSFGVGVPADPGQTVSTERTPLSDAIRFLSLSGQATFAGAVAFHWAIRLEDDARMRRPLIWLAQYTRLGIALGAVGALYLQSQVLDASVLNVLSTRWGMTWLLRAATGVVVIARAEAWMRGREASAALFAGAFLLATTSLASHSAAKFGLLGAAVDWLHLCSASVWWGGVLCAAIAIVQGERKFLWSFSILATAAVGGLAATGAWLSSEQVGSWSALLLTGYGRVLILKSAVAAGALGLGALHALRGAGGKTVVIEAGLGTIVILSAAVLTNLPPAYSQATDGAPTRVEQTKTIGGLSASVAMWPARLGANTVEVRLTDTTGNPVTASRVRLQFLPVDGGAVVSDVTLNEVGQGLYSGTGTNLIDPGEWQILLAVNEKDFLNFDYFIGPDEAVRRGGEPLGLAVQAVGWLNRYALAFASGFLLLGAAIWSGLAWRSVRSLPDRRARLVMWLAPGLLFAGAIWLWIKLIF